MQTLKDEISVGEADFPKPFKNGLEFNAPVHGTWNIVHIGLQMPGAVQIYVCAKNCMRGVILTAAEMNESERFSFVILNEEDMVRGNLDEVTIEGVTDVIRKRDRAGMRPRAVQLFTVCTHHFLGTDYKRLYQILEERFPDIDFYRCYMDPIMQKKGLTPDQKLRRAMLEKLQPLPAREKTAAILGSDFLLDESSDLIRLLRRNGWDIRQNKACKSYEEYLQMAEAELFLAVYPPAKAGVKLCARRLGRPFLYLPSSFDEELIREQLNQLEEYMGIQKAENPQVEKQPDLEKEIADTVRLLKEKMKNTSIFIDGTAHPRPLGLAHFLLKNGFNVEKVYLDAISLEEEKDVLWLKEYHPELLLSATIHVKKRRMAADKKTAIGLQRKKLAIGQKAAYFEQTPYFVNMVAGFGLHGLDGMKKILIMMSEALDEEKDLRDIVPRKGLGCESCI